MGTKVKTFLKRRIETILWASALGIFATAIGAEAISTFTGNVVIPAAGTLTAQGITGSTQCAQFSATGVLQGSGSNCAGSSSLITLAVGTPQPASTGQAQIGYSIGVATPAPAASGAIAANGAIAAGASTGATLTAGDLGASRNTSSGEVNIGGTSSSALLDYGVTTSAVVTVSKPLQATPACTPNAQSFVGTASDTSGTYTTPTCNSVAATYLEVRLVGGGGGGGGSGTGGGVGGTGDTSTFSAGTMSAPGGIGGADSAQGAPGAGGAVATGGSVINTSGNGGTWAFYVSASTYNGGNGAPSALGGNVGGNNNAGANGSPCGAGGQGGGESATVIVGGGGGSGAYAESMITSPSASYTYLAGKYGAGGSSGTSGFVGGHGGGGCVIVIAHWF